MTRATVWRRKILSLCLARYAIVTVAIVLTGGLFSSAARAGQPFGPSAFGVYKFESSAENQDKSPVTQAGSHPYALTTALIFNHEVVSEKERFAENFKEEVVPRENPEVIADIYGSPKEVVANLPAGMVINPGATSIKCTEAELESKPAIGGGCPAASAVGVATVYANGFNKIITAVYNMVPPQGVPAELGFNPGELGIVAHVIGNTRTGEDYGLTGKVLGIGQTVKIFGATLTLWGDPSNASHDAERGYCEKSPPFEKKIEEEFYQFFLKQAVEEERPLSAYPKESEFAFRCHVERSFTPLLTMPGSCTGTPLETTASVDSWQEPENQLTAPAAVSPAVTGCGALDFNPGLNVEPTSRSTATEAPTGMNFDLRMPQEESLTGLAEADLKNAVVTLPAGVAVSPSAANGLEGCSPAQIGFKGLNHKTGIDEFTPELPRPLSPGVNFCPDASKLGEVEVITPLLEKPLKGAVYLAQQGTFEGSLVGLYIVAESQGALVKLGGTVALNESTGQIAATFKNNPQLPFSELKLKMFAGPRAPLVTPSACGAYTTTSDLTPWSTPFTADATPSSGDFVVNSDCATSGFNPFFQAGAMNNQAGAYSPFSVTIARQDREQRLAGLQVTTPPGLLGVLKSVEQCPEPQASQGGCGSASKIGETTVSVGPGSAPYWVKGGEVYLTGPYHGAPFGLSAVVPTTAGPFTLTGNGGFGKEIVRARVEVDSHTAQVRVTSDPLPTILQGIPLDVRTINVTIDRPEFLFNPTDCSQLSVGGTATSTANASMAVSSPFEVANCANLPFKPTFSASTPAKTSKAKGSGITVKVGSGAGQANIAKVRVILPKQLPARLTTLQKACTEATFNVNPALCPAASDVGSATAVTPVLAHPLTGPAYLVSHGGAAFPDLVFVLQGEGILLYLDGNTNIKKGITSSTFNSVPDAPISTFETVFPQGPTSVLTTDIPAKAKGSMCQQKLMMPTTITGQNGAVVTRTTKIAVTGCAKKAKAKRVSRQKK